MSGYVGSCQSLGFVCDWQAAADDPAALAATFVEHLNDVHGTGSTSPALTALVERLLTRALDAELFNSLTLA